MAAIADAEHAGAPLNDQWRYVLWVGQPRRNFGDLAPPGLGGGGELHARLWTTAAFQPLQRKQKRTDPVAPLTPQTFAQAGVGPWPTTQVCVDPIIETARICSIGATKNIEHSAHLPNALDQPDADTSGSPPIASM